MASAVHTHRIGAERFKLDPCRCPQCGAVPSRMSGYVPTSIHITRIDEAGGRLDDDEAPERDIFDESDTEACWEYDEAERDTAGRVTLYCPTPGCKQCQWQAHVVELDDDEQPAEQGDEAKAPSTIRGAERNTVLAALRLYQGQIDTGEAEAVQDIATNGGAHAPLTVAEIDALCERLNCE